MSTTSNDAETANGCFCVSCDNCLGRELTCANLGLSHPNPILFVTPQWRCLPFVYVVYRCLVALYFVTWLVLSGVWKYDWAASDDDRIKWFIYLTNWSFFALTANVVLQAALVGGTYGKMGEYKVGTQTDDDTNNTMPWYYKLMWVIHNVACNASFVTSLAYWVFIYKADMYVHVVDVHTHAVNSAYVLVDTFISAFPLRLLHFYHGVTFAVVYIIFSVLYSVSGQTNALGHPYIYSILNWQEPRTAFLYAVIVGLVAVPLLWLLLFALHKTRLAIHRAVSR